MILEDHSRLKIDFFLISKISIDFYLDFGAEKSDDNRIKSSKISLFFSGLITSTQSLIRTPNVLDFKYELPGPDLLTIRERTCFRLDNGKYVMKAGLPNNRNHLLDFLK